MLEAWFHTKPTSLRVVVMPVGRVAVEDSNEAPQVIVGDPEPAVNDIQSFWPVVGVPVRFVVIEVMFAV